MLTDFAEALAELEARGPGRMIPDLTRIRAVCDLLDHPELTYPTVHVAGTNGKTTTARLVGRILCAHGVTAGVHTSPHLATVRERFALCDDPISEEEFAETYAHVRPVLEKVDQEGERVTYFEALAAMAFLWFADKPVQAGVFEVGMGGTWDATNMIRTEVGVVCPIGLDHPELGSTIAEVAGEKAGILKEGTVAVVEAQRPEAFEVIAGRAEEVGARLLLEGRDFTVEDRDLAVGGQQITISGVEETYEDLYLPLHGEHQAHHAAAAVAGAEAFLGRALSGNALRKAFEGASSPGRLEVVSRGPVVVLDGAHNPDGAEALADGLREAFRWDRLVLVIAVLDTKDAIGIIQPLAPLADVAYACANENPRSLSPEQMAAVCEEAGLKTRSFGSVGDALNAAEADANPGDLILVTGSLCTVADARLRYLRE